MDMTLKNFNEITKFFAKEVAKKLNKIGQNVPDDTKCIAIFSKDNEILSIIYDNCPRIRFEDGCISYNYADINYQNIMAFCSIERLERLCQYHKVKYWTIDEAITDENYSKSIYLD